MTSAAASEEFGLYRVATWTERTKHSSSPGTGMAIGSLCAGRTRPILPMMSMTAKRYVGSDPSMQIRSDILCDIESNN